MGLRGPFQVTPLTDNHNVSNNLPPVTMGSVTVCDNIDSLAVHGDESTGITHFVQEACEKVDAFGDHYVRPKQVFAQTELQDLTKYFARPRIFLSGDLNTNKTTLAQQDINTAFLFTTLFPSSRLAGVRGLRFKMVFTIQVAAQPFNAGLLVAAFQYTPFRSSVFGYERVTTPQTCTNLPTHVRLDVSTSTQVQLHVPFLWNSDYMPNPPSLNVAYGRFAINQVLGSNVVSPAIQPTFRCFLHLEDLELIGGVPEKFAATTLQSSKVIRGPVESEYDNDAKPLSSALMAGSKMVRYLGYGIPSLSSLAAPASWFLGKSAGVAKYLGYSKPQIQDPILRTFRTRNAQETNVDVPSATLMVAPFVSNHLPVDPAFGATDVDEMALSYVLGQYTQVFSGALLASANNATVIYGAQLSPSTLWYRENLTGISSGPLGNIRIPTLSGPTANSFIPSGITFWAQMFSYWRGPIKLRFTFAKSKMHTARLIAAFVPDIADTGSNVIQRPASEVTGSGFFGTSGQTAIWDLKDGNVFEFECPYMGPAAYLPFTDGMGAFTVSILDPLKQPASAPALVPFVVEVCAGKDFSLSKFAGPLFAPHEYPTPRLQSGKIVTFEKDMTQETAGEAFVSVKQIISLPHTNLLDYSDDASVAIVPWFYNRTYPNTVPGPLGNEMRPVSFTPGGSAATCYLFAKGATDAHFYTLGTSTTPTALYRAIQYPGTGGYSVASAPSASTWVGSRPNSSTPSANEVGPAAHFRFPLYNIVRRICPSLLNNLIWNPTTIAQSQAPVVGQFSISDVSIAASGAPYSGTNRFQAFFSRAAGDDAALAHYMGPVPLVLPSTNVGNIYDPDSINYYTPGP